jgi:hypothetical protein
VELRKDDPGLARKLRQDLIMLWDQRNQMPNYTNEQIITFNTEIHKSITEMPFCDVWDEKLPSHFSMGSKSTFICHANVSILWLERENLWLA